MLMNTSVKTLLIILICFSYVLPAFSLVEKKEVLFKYMAFDDLISQVNDDQKIEIYLDEACSNYYLNLLIPSKEDQSNNKKNLSIQEKIQKICKSNSLEEIKILLGNKTYSLYADLLQNLEEGNVFLLPQYYHIYQALDSFDELVKNDNENRRNLEEKVSDYHLIEAQKIKAREELIRQAKLKKYYQNNKKENQVLKYGEGSSLRNLILSPEGRYILKMDLQELKIREHEYQKTIKEKKLLIPIALHRILSIYSQDKTSWNFVKEINIKKGKIWIDFSLIDQEKIKRTLEHKKEEINRIDLDVEKINDFKKIYETYHSSRRLEVDEEFFTAQYFKKMPSGLVVYFDIPARTNQEYLRMLVESQHLIGSKIKNFWLSDKPNTYIIFDDGRFKEVYIAEYFQEETQRELNTVEKYTWILRKFHQSLFDEIYKSISPYEAASIQMYTGALYSDINQCLRNENCPPSLEKKIGHIKSGIEKLSQSGLERITVFRGVERLPLELVEKLENSETNLIVDKGFQSTTTNAEIAKRFAKRKAAFEKNRLRNYIFVMKVKSCVSVERLSYVKKEDEYLCPRELHYQVRKHPNLHNVYELIEN